ncbi:MAG TPA: universal stress protein [Gemmatimonadales bacterium]|jgi:nucleotide-binding universal stress UspA family protein|nr:universal stress protein [Gemmatimonadales bacterium]
MRHLLVPLDGSGFGESALWLAAAIARRKGTKLELVTVHPAAVNPDISASVMAEIEAMSRAYTRTYLEGLAKQVHGRFHIEVSTTVPEGAAATTIVEHAQADPPELIVMTTHGRSGPSRHFLGSVADRLLRELHCPFLLVRPATKAVTSELPSAVRVLVPLDGSALAESVIDEVARLFSPSQVVLHLVRVVAPAEVFPIGAPMPLPPAGRNLTEVRLASAQRYLEGTAWTLRKAGWHVEHEVVTAWTPSAVILSSAEAHRCDLIAMATRGLGGIKRMFLGSVADKVIRGATTPVLVVNPVAGAFSPTLGESLETASEPQRIMVAGPLTEQLAH